MKLPKDPTPVVLLVDRNPLKQNLRATVFRNCEIDVHTTNGVVEAQHLCRVHRYDLVLLGADHDFGEASLFCEELRKLVPRQRVALLVGPPKYLQEMAVQQKPRTPLRFNRRLRLVEPQSAPTQWNTLVRRLLAVG